MTFKQCWNRDKEVNPQFPLQGYSCFHAREKAFDLMGNSPTMEMISLIVIVRADSTIMIIQDCLIWVIFIYECCGPSATRKHINTCYLLRKNMHRTDIVAAMGVCGLPDAFESIRDNGMYHTEHWFYSCDTVEYCPISHLTIILASSHLNQTCKLHGMNNVYLVLLTYVVVGNAHR